MCPISKILGCRVVAFRLQRGTSRYTILQTTFTKWFDSNINNRIGGWLEGSFLGVSAFEEREICWWRRCRYWQHNTVLLGKPDKFWPVLFKGAISVVEFLFYIFSQLNDLCMVLQYGENEILTDVRPEHFLVRAETDKEKNIE